MPRTVLAGFAALIVLACAPPVVAQTANVTTVEGPAVGQQTTLSQAPRPVTDAISLRAVGIEGRRDTTMWAFSVIGADGVRDAAFHVGGDTVAPVSVSDADGQGRILISVTKELFLSLMQAPGAAMTVNGVRFTLPPTLRADMKAIFETVA